MVTDFAWKIVDAPKVKKMGMMEEQRHNDKSQLKLFGWGDGVGKGQIEFLIDDDLTGESAGTCMRHVPCPRRLHQSGHVSDHQTSATTRSSQI